MESDDLGSTHQTEICKTTRTTASKSPFKVRQALSETMMLEVFWKEHLWNLVATVIWPFMKKNVFVNNQTDLNRVYASWHLFYQLQSQQSNPLMIQHLLRQISAHIPGCPNLVGMMSMLKVAASRYKQASIRAALLSNLSTNKRKAQGLCSIKSFSAIFSCKWSYQRPRSFEKGLFERTIRQKSGTSFTNLSRILNFVTSHGDRPFCNVIF